MLFNPKKYEEIIENEECKAIIKMFLVIILSILLGTTISKLFKFDLLMMLLASIIIGIIIGYIIYSSSQAKIEEMKWKLDIYNKIMQ